MVSRDITRGSIVGICIPSRATRLALERGYAHFGSCGDGTRPLIKIVKGVPGDTVLASSKELAIRGTSFKTAVLTKDSMGRELPKLVGDFEVQPDEYWVFGSHKSSFDSRYFGAVPKSSIISVMEPLMMF
jgi:conjugative transfer signal peptidase TraF